MRFKISLRGIEYSIVTISSLPLAWILSHSQIGVAVSSYVYNVVGLWIPSFLLLALVIAPIFLGSYLLGGALLRIVGLEFGIYLLPALLGLPVKLLTGYIVGAVIYTGSLVVAKYVEWISREIPGISEEEAESAGISAVREILFPIPLGLGYFFLLFGWSSWGKSPANIFPFYFLLPFLMGAAIAIASSFPGEPEKSSGNASRTFLVLRTYMTVGDSFTVEYLGWDRRGTTFGLVGGSPVKRPLLLKWEWNKRIPEVVVLRSPWEVKILTKKREWVEENIRYVLFVA